MAQFATKTTVSTDKSRAELEATLRRYGAEGFRYGWAHRGGRRLEQVDFQTHDRVVRFTLAMPPQDADEFRFTSGRRQRRSERAALQAWEQACRQRWRALCLAVKAKLECVEVGISEFEDEFLAHIVDPETSQTLGQIMRPQLARRYAGLTEPLSLPGLPAPPPELTPQIAEEASSP